MNVFMKDVLSQPTALRSALQFYAEQGYDQTITAPLYYDQVLFVGMGSSYYASLGASQFLRANGIPARTVSAGQLLDYEIEAISKYTLLVLVSQSGESAEIVRLCQTLPREQNVIAITNNPDSPLGRRAGKVFDLKVANETTVSTRTYVATCVLCGLLATRLACKSGPDFLAGVATAIDGLERFLTSHEQWQSVMHSFAAMPHNVCLLGKGYSLASAQAGALFISELAKHPAFGLDTNEFRHGPFEMVGPDFLALMLAPDGTSYGTNERMAADISGRGGKVIFITNRPPAFTSPKLLVVNYPALAEELCPLVEIGVVQLFDNMLAEAKGLDVGVFRWGSKVTTVE